MTVQLWQAPRMRQASGRGLLAFEACLHGESGLADLRQRVRRLV